MGPSTESSSPRATRIESRIKDSPLASRSISGTPPPRRPFTSSTLGPSGVSFISVWKLPVPTPRAPSRA